MAGLIQDSNTNGHSAAAMKKGGLKLSGRKPLVGGSNSANPFLKNASEKMVRKKNSAVIKDENVTRVKKNISKAPGTRKVLADISNSIRHQTSRKKQNAEKSIADEEYVPHNHEACRKAQEREAVYMDDLLGLANGCPKELPPLKRPETPPMTPPLTPPMTPPLTPPMTIPMTSPRLMEEMRERIRAARKFDFPFPESPESPASPESPESPGVFYRFMKDRYDSFTLKLIDSPKLPKH